MPTNEQITDGNKLIAEFMGIKLNGGMKSIFDEPNLKFFRITVYEQDGLCEWCHNDVSHGHNIRCYVLDTDNLMYQSSWDWIMPVVKRIHDTIGFKSMDECSEREWQVSTHLTRMSITADIETVWNACVLYIEWYNNTQKQ